MFISIIIVTITISSSSSSSSMIILIIIMFRFEQARGRKPGFVKAAPKSVGRVRRIRNSWKPKFVKAGFRNSWKPAYPWEEYDEYEDTLCVSKMFIYFDLLQQILCQEYEDTVYVSIIVHYSKYEDNVCSKLCLSQERNDFRDCCP